tara:strand:- start:533 stop:1012 length:480 start_codon:yes stop_codon:yes gene_type:complete
MTITLAQLAAAATGSATRSTANNWHSVSVEEARSSIVIKDGNKKPATDGSQKLVVQLGRHVLPLDCIKAGTTRVAVTAEQIEGYTAALQSAVNDGIFDEAIVKAQELGKEAAAKAAANPRTRTAKVAPEEAEGLDLDAIEGEVGDSVEEPEVDLDDLEV